MTHWKKCMNKEFLGSWDLDGRKSVVLKIKEVAGGEITSERGTDKRPIATFYKTDKKMVLNTTNCEAIEEMYGSEIEGWAGKLIEIFVADVKVKKETVKALRIRHKIPGGTLGSEEPNLAPETVDHDTGEITEGGEE